MTSLRRRRVTRWCLVLALGGVVWLALLRESRQAPVEDSTVVPVSEDGTLATVDADFMARVYARMLARKRHLDSNCDLLDERNETSNVANPWEFLVDRQHKLVWCNVFKAASTSWMYNFNLLAGYEPEYLDKTRKVPLTLARERYPRPSLKQLEEAVNDSVSFLIVRHPFERLVSAFRDKIERSVPMSPHRKMADMIVKKYRDPMTLETESGRKNHPTFSEFVFYLLDEHRRGEAFDMHWTPVTDFCTPCRVNFTVLAKFETLEEDQRYLIELAGLQKLIRPEWKNPTKGGATDKLATSHFAPLARAQILQLYDIYRHDFQLFDYTLDGYLPAERPHL